jgi:hypothetical protein
MSMVVSLSIHALVLRRIIDIMHEWTNGGRQVRKKTSAELAAERDEIEAKIRELRTVEAKQARQQEGHRHRLLGIKMEMLMARDASLRMRMEVEMQGFCTRPYDRQAFGFSTSTQDGKRNAAVTNGHETYFERLGLPDDHPRKLFPARGRKKTAKANAKEAAVQGIGHSAVNESSAAGGAGRPELREDMLPLREPSSSRAVASPGVVRGVERQTPSPPPIPRPTAPSRGVVESTEQGPAETPG